MLARLKRAVRRAAGASAVSLLLAGCAGGPRVSEVAAPVPPAEPGALIELLDGVRVAPERGLVEFDGMVAIDCHQAETPDVYLEVICCGRDTREHEALVVTSVPASSVHAALLAVGAEPGAPGGWSSEGGRARPVPPRGDPVRVTLVTRSAGGEVEHDPGDWIRERGAGRPLREAAPDGAWVFAGSRVLERGGRDVYDADGTGQLIGLHTFGSETIAWTRVESPDSWVEEARWLANAEVVPAIGTPVTVRLRVGSAAGSP